MYISILQSDVMLSWHSSCASKRQFADRVESLVHMQTSFDSSIRQARCSHLTCNLAADLQVLLVLLFCLTVISICIYNQQAFCKVHAELCMQHCCWNNSCQLCLAVKLCPELCLEGGRPQRRTLRGGVAADQDAVVASPARYAQSAAPCGQCTRTSMQHFKQM